VQSVRTERSVSAVVVAVDVITALHATTWVAHASALPGGEACRAIVRVHVVTMATSVGAPVAAAVIISVTQPPDSVCVHVASADRTVPIHVHLALGDTTAIR